MSDLRELLSTLNRDVDDLPRPAASEVRLAAGRRSGLLLPAIAVAVAGTGIAVALLSTQGDPKDVLKQPVPPASSTTPGPAESPSPAAQPVRTWLPVPWELLSATKPSAVGPEHRFCGAQLSRSGYYGSRSDPTTVAEQRFAHPSGRTARLTRYETPSFGDAAQLFKLSFSECVEEGNVRGIGGPRNVWVYKGVAGGSDFGALGGVPRVNPESTREPGDYGPILHVVEVNPASESDRLTRSDAEAVLDAWAASERSHGTGQPSDQSSFAQGVR